MYIAIYAVRGYETPGDRRSFDSSEPPNEKEGVSCTGEGVILEATALGLGTCWVNGFFRPDAAKEHIALADNERVYAVTPIGYTKKGFSIKEKIYEGAAPGR